MLHSGTLVWLSLFTVNIYVVPVHCAHTTLCTLVSLLRPGRVRSIVINPSVCLSVCLSVRKYISGTAGPIRTKFCVQIPCGHGSVLLWRFDGTLCTSGFMDDVMFGHNGRDADRWMAAQQRRSMMWWYRGGVWCLWMRCFHLLFAYWLLAAAGFSNLDVCRLQKYKSPVMEK